MITSSLLVLALQGAIPDQEIQGTVFLDHNGDGQRDLEDPEIAGLLVWVDLNGNGRVDPHEPLTRSDANGRYRLRVPLGMQHLLRLDVPEGFAASAPPEHALAFQGR